MVLKTGFCTALHAVCCPCRLRAMATGLSSNKSCGIHLVVLLPVLTCQVLSRQWNRC